MQDDDGQTCDVHSISAGLDYPGVGPEHSYWKDTGRVRTPAAATTRPWPPSTPWPAPRASCRPWNPPTPWPRRCSWRPTRAADEIIVVCLSGRGDKDAAEVARLRGH